MIGLLIHCPAPITLPQNTNSYKSGMILNDWHVMNRIDIKTCSNEKKENLYICFPFFFPFSKNTFLKFSFMFINLNHFFFNSNCIIFLLYSCNNKTTTSIQISRLFYFGFFSNTNHQMMILLTPIVSR